MPHSTLHQLICQSFTSVPNLTPLMALEMIPPLQPQSLYRRPAAKTSKQPAPSETLTTALLYPRLHADLYPQVGLLDTGGFEVRAVMVLLK